MYVGSTTNTIEKGVSLNIHRGIEAKMGQGQLTRVLPGVAYHVTQRGVNRSDVFFGPADLFAPGGGTAGGGRGAGVGVVPDDQSVHWVVVPEREESLAVLFRRVHGRYAQYLNARRRRTGHLWQNGFSRAVAADREHIALRYVEWNPVRAAMVETPEEYAWSSAAAPLAGFGAVETALLDWNYWRERGGEAGWKENVGRLEDRREAQRLRRATYAGSPLGSAEFVEAVEREFDRQWRKRGRPGKKDAQEEKGTEQYGSLSAG